MTYTYKSIAEAYQDVLHSHAPGQTRSETPMKQYNAKREKNMAKRGITKEEATKLVDNPESLKYILEALQESGINANDMRYVIEADQTFQPGESTQSYLKRRYGHDPAANKKAAAARKAAPKSAPKRKSGVKSMADAVASPRKGLFGGTKTD